MKNIVGVRLREEGGKIYFFDPNNLELKKNDHVVVDTQLGPEFGTIVIAKREVSDDQIVHPLKKVVRIATPQDVKKQEEVITDLVKKNNDKIMPPKNEYEEKRIIDYFRHLDELTNMFMAKYEKIMKGDKYYKWFKRKNW